MVRPKKDDLRPLSLYYYLNLQVKSQSKAYRLILRVLSLKYTIILRVFQPLLQCPSLGIYRPRGNYDIPIISGYLCLTVKYLITGFPSFGSIPNITEIRYRNIREYFLFKSVTKKSLLIRVQTANPTNIGIK